VANKFSASVLTRFLILVKNLGAERALSVFADPVVRDVMQINPAITLTDVAKWQARISRAQVKEFMRQLATLQCHDGALSGSRLALISIPDRRGKTGLLIDIERGFWILAARFRDDKIEQVVAQVRKWLSDSGVNAESVFAEARFSQPLRKALLTTPVFDFDKAEVVASEDSALDATLRTLSNLKADLSYLALPKPFHFPMPFDLALSVAAQHLMLSLASRLPGFARSGLPYLYRNFLDFAATLEPESERVVVKLGRPPLNIVLSMTGLARAAYKIDWNDDPRPFTLFQEA
jgi:hypothetical protein